MLRLAVATDAETFERMREPLGERDIAVEHVRTRARTLDLAADAFEAFDVDRDGSPANGGDRDASASTSNGRPFDVGFVYPPRIAEGGVADALLDIPWVNDRERVLRSRHKAETLARLRRAGVPTPETVMVSNPADEGDVRRAFERFDAPVVVKPNSTTRGVGVAKASDVDSFLGVVDYLDLLHDYRATADRSYLVQEYLPDASDYRAMVVDGEYVGAVERHLPDDALDAGQWKHNVHRGAHADGVALPPELRELAEDAATALDIPWLGVDVLVPAGDAERAVVNETNARPTIDSATKYEPGFWDRLAALVRRTAEEG